MSSQPPPTHERLPWQLVVPVKDTREGKSRLAGTAGGDRSSLSRAIADDTIDAAVDAVGADAVVLVSSDAGLSASWGARGVEVVADPGHGLNPAVTAGLERVEPSRRPAVLLGDLPALRAADLVAALGRAERERQSFVPDLEGRGTVLRCGQLGAGFTPRFGPDSARRHERDGAVRLDLDLPRLRTDVDDSISLRAAHQLGLGRRTRHVVATRGSGWIHPMQATVHTFDGDTRSGSVLRDDGAEVTFDAAAFDASGLRLLRPGQRLTVEVDDGAVTSLRIVGIGSGQHIR